jgi:hypothetical protein
MNTIFVLIVSTTLLWADARVETFMNEFNYSTMEQCINHRDYVERDRGQPADGSFRAAHLGVCVERKINEDTP